MANNLGDVNVRVTAEVAQFRAAMAEAKAKVAGLQQQTAQMASTTQVAARSASSMTTAMTRAGTAMRTLGLATVGVRGPLATVLGNLSMLAAGGAGATFAIAGVGLIAAAFQRLRERAREAKEEIAKVLEEAQKAGQQAFGKGEDARRGRILSQMGQLQAELDRLTADFEKNQADLAKRRGMPGTRKGWFEEQETAGARLVAKMAEVRNQLTGLRGLLTSDQPTILVSATDNTEALNRALEKSAELFAKIRDYLYGLSPQTLPTVPITDEGPVNPVDMIARAQGRESRLRRKGKEMTDRLTQPFRDQQAAQEMSEVGELWARSILTSMLRAFRDGNVGRAFANIFGTLLEQIIVGAIIKGLKSAKGGPLGFLGSLLSFDTGGVVPGRSGQAQLAVVHGGETVMPTRGGSGVFQVAVPQLAGPALITNAEWQRIWRDTAREATRQGFRMAVI